MDWLYEKRVPLFFPGFHGMSTTYEEATSSAHKKEEHLDGHQQW